jgi:zinc transport system substrate-binding protein
MCAHRRRWAFVLAVLVGAVTASGVIGIGAAAAGAARIRVVTTFFPVADAVAALGGADVSVQNLTPPGAEPHDLELTPDDRDAIEDADLVVVLGGGFQPAIEDAADERDGPTLALVDQLARSDRARARRDPHLWLDPVQMRDLVRQLARALTARTPAAAGAIARRAAQYDEQLADLDADYRLGLADCARRVVVTAHDAFGWLARRYDLRVEGIADLDPEAEPGPERIAALTDLVQRTGTTTVFTEDLVSEKVAATLAREAGVRTATLSPLEGLTERQLRRGADYFSVMRTNLERLRAALDCA